MNLISGINSFLPLLKHNSPCCYVHLALLTLMMKMLVSNVINGDDSICTYIYIILIN